MDDKKKMELEADTRAYLEKIARTVSESKALMSQIELRMAETDRMLASQGLTREQVQAMSFTPEQLKAVNQELARRGLPPLENEQAMAGDAPPQADSPSADEGRAAEPKSDKGDSKEDLENRRRKFNVMMNNLRL